VPPELEQLVMSCLAKKPEDRPPSAADLDRRLRGLAVDPWTEADAEQWWAAASASGSPDGGASGESVTRSAADFRETAAGARTASQDLRSHHQPQRSRDDQ
jgi:serine/threonine-protein kinase